MTDVRADRHIVAGGRGTAVISARAVAIIDAPPASAPAVAWENLLFGPDAADSPVDPFASIVDDDLTSFALVEATTTGTAVLRHGSTHVHINDRPWATDDPTASTVVGTDDPVTISLTGPAAADEAPTGQWVSSGVIAAESVTVGRLEPPPAARPTQVVPAVGRPGPEPVDADFGNLLGNRRPTSADPTPPSDPEPEAEPADPGTVDASGTSTAAYVHTNAIASGAVLRTTDGRRLPVTSPIVFGRRPPDDPIGTQVPQIVAVDDPLISRHHATALVVDGRLVVVDEGSTNGTTVTTPDGVTVACVADHPTEVPPGAVIDVAGVLQAIHESGDS